MTDYNSYSDDELYLLLVKGDLSAFNVIHKRYYGVLYAHASKKLSDKEEIKDLLQELFCSVWKNRKKLNLTVNLKVYLYTSVRNRIFNIYKHNKIRSDYIEYYNHIDPETVSSDENYRLRELIAIIESEINALPPQMRLVFEMSRNQHLSHKEIADELDLSPLTVKKHINNSLKILRVKLGPYFFMLFF